MFGFIVSIVNVTLELFILFKVSFAQIVILCFPSDQVTEVIFAQFDKVIFKEYVSLEYQQVDIPKESKVV